MTEQKIEEVKQDMAEVGKEKPNSTNKANDSLVDKDTERKVIASARLPQKRDSMRIRPQSAANMFNSIRVLEKQASQHALSR